MANFAQGIAVGFVCGFVLGLTAQAKAADALTCSLYGENVEQLVKQLTNDDDVAQAARERGEAYCYVIDYPIDIQILTGKKPKNASAGTVPAGFDPTWVALCKKYYRSFREADGTVIRRGVRGRTKCPL